MKIRKVSCSVPYIYDIYFEHIYLGTAKMGDDGFYSFWFEENSTGSWDSWVLKEIAQILDELNKEFKDELNKEFNKKN